MSVVSEHRVTELVRKIRESSPEMAVISLTLFAEGIFTTTCDSLKDLVVGRVVNKGVDADTAREAATAIEEYQSLIKNEH